MKPQNFTKIFSVLCGAVFLVSGIGKSLAIADFTNLITSYGFENFSFVAPVIAWAEVVMGLALILRCYSKQTAFSATLFLVAVTCIYLYGYFRHNIIDCGCFGAVSKMNSVSPVFVVVRNLLLIILLYVIWKNAETYKNHLAEWKMAVIICVLSLSSFFAGKSYRPLFVAFNSETQSNYEGKMLVQTPLSRFVSTSKDSVYLVFVFSYTCPHCLNSIENLKQYQSQKLVDKIIGLAVQDSVTEAIFTQNFQVEFPIKKYSSKTVTSLTTKFPTAFYIKNNMIEKEIVGELPCVYNFKKMFNN